jgi:hypothetical protein
MSSVLTPDRAARMAAPKPAGPPPITTTSAAMGMCVSGTRMLFSVVAARAGFVFRWAPMNIPAPLTDVAPKNVLRFNFCMKTSIRGGLLGGFRG